MLLLFHYFGKAVNLIACKQDAQTFDWAHFSSIINYIEQIKMHKPTSGIIILAQIFRIVFKQLKQIHSPILLASFRLVSKVSISISLFMFFDSQ